MAKILQRKKTLKMLKDHTSLAGLGQNLVDVVNLPATNQICLYVK